MINVIHQNGTSFKGLMAYLMHDKGADTSERVAWTHSHNLATDDPEIGWRTMAATAMLQSDLKREAGIPATGRKSIASVMHYTLSWEATERDELSRDDMVEAALASMTYMGTQEGEKIGRKKNAIRTQFADEHQAIIVCHDEGPGNPPHVHIMLNRVHPDHGVMLPDSKDYEKLSAWALEYRKAQGREDCCPQRVINAAKRAQGILTSYRRKSRNAYEQEQELQAADPGTRKAALLEIIKRRTAELRTKTLDQHKKQAAEIHQLETKHMNGEKMQRQRTGEEIRAAKAKIKTGYAPRIDELTRRQLDEMKAFDKAQETVRGRVRNAWAALKTKQWMTEIRQTPLHAAAHAFKLSYSSGLQQKDIEDFHAKEQQQMKIEIRKAGQAAARDHRSQEQARLDEKRRLFEIARNDLLLQHDMNKAKLKAEWNEHTLFRDAAASEDERVRELRSQENQNQRKNTPSGDKSASGPSVKPPNSQAVNKPAPPPKHESLKPEFEQAAVPPAQQMDDAKGDRQPNINKSDKKITAEEKRKREIEALKKQIRDANRERDHGGEDRGR